MAGKKEYSVPTTGWIDCSMPLHSKMRKWPEDPQPRFEWMLERKKGDRTDMITMNLITHTGTHIDAPLHFSPDGNTIDNMPVNMMVGPARVIEIKDPESVKLKEVEPYNIRPGERILFKTQNSYKHYDTDKFFPVYVYLTIEVAHYLRDRKVSLVGLDAIALGPFYDYYAKPPEGASPQEVQNFEKQNKVARDITYEVHNSFLKNGIWVLEHVNLKNVRPGPCILACLPMKIKNGDAAPTRCIIRPL
jgi:arylformamidase